MKKSKVGIEGPHIINLLINAGFLMGLSRGCCCLGIAPRDQVLKKCAWLLHPIHDNAQLATRDCREVARALNQSCYPHTGSGGHSWCLSSSPSLSVGFSTQEKEETKDLTVLGLTRFFDQQSSYPAGQHILAFCIKYVRLGDTVFLRGSCCRPVTHLVYNARVCC